MERTMLITCSPEDLQVIIKTAISDAFAEREAMLASPPPAKEKVLTSQHVCEMLDISYPTLKKLMDAGEIKSKLLGGKYRFLQSEVERAISKSKK